MGNVDSFWFHSNPDSNGFGYLSNAFPTLMGLDQVQYAQEGINPLSIPLYYNYGADMGTSSSLQLFPSNSVAFGAESTYKPRIHEFYADSNGQEGDTQTTTSNSNESQCRSDLSEQKESRKRPLEITSGHSSCESKRAHLDICGSNDSKKATYWISCSDDKARTTCSSKTHAFPVINGSTKTKGRQSNANDPQSIAARHRCERISERLKILQDLVPNSSKVDLVRMLEKAINYVKFLQLQDIGTIGGNTWTEFAIQYTQTIHIEPTHQFTFPVATVGSSHLFAVLLLLAVYMAGFLCHLHAHASQFCRELDMDFSYHASTW